METRLRRRKCWVTHLTTSVLRIIWAWQDGQKGIYGNYGIFRMQSTLPTHMFPFRSSRLKITRFRPCGTIVLKNSIENFSAWEFGVALSFVFSTFLAVTVRHCGPYHHDRCISRFGSGGRRLRIRGFARGLLADERAQLLGVRSESQSQPLTHPRGVVLCVRCHGFELLAKPHPRTAASGDY